ncbi:MAG TPA: ATP synthase F1 subunit epsilon [Patescibacteria group bacterium]|jgi:F-type H+-transporting ATPase subunit epsilon|nr:ATP synthase F1 subunit epsilon [Patescibacteria group bacterium]
MAKLQLQLVTPERTVLTEEVASLVCPTTEGQITILPGHVPLIATLVSGELIAQNGDEPHNIHVAGGFVQVQNGGQEIIILADAAEHFYEIDITRAEEAKALAEKTLQEQTLSNEEYALASAMLQKSLSRINIARKHAHRRTRITSEGVLKE